jgi:hypothetical protein
MRLELTRTGGLAGLRQAAAVDDAALPPAERAELHELVAAADPWSLPKDVGPAGPSPDRFRYVLRLSEGARSHEIRASEESLPEALKALVRWLESRSRPVAR